MSTTVSNEELAARIQGGETALYAPLWEQTKRLLFKLSMPMYHRRREQCAASGVEEDDVRQICFIALCDAVKAFKPQEGKKLSSYVEYHVKNRFQEILRIRTSRKEPLNSCSSLDDEININDEDSITVLDTLADDTAEQAFEDAEERVFRSQLHDELDAAMEKSLSQEQRDLFNAIYYGGQTETDAARRFGIPHSRARYYHANGLCRLRSQNPRLKIYAEHYITNHAYHYTSLTSFRERRASSPELILERLLCGYDNESR